MCSGQEKRTIRSELSFRENDQLSKSCQIAKMHIQAVRHCIPSQI